MDSLHRKPTTNNGLVHNITPENAGWRYVGFDLYRLSSGQSANGATRDREVIIVIVEGKAHIKSSENDWGVLGDRMSVFEKTHPIACISLMITNGKWRHPQNAVAVCSAPGKRNYEPCLVGPDKINLTKRGQGVNTRYINNIAMEDLDICDSLLVTDLYTRWELVVLP